MKGEKGKVKGEVEERLHRKLEVWRRALSLAKSVYEVTCLFPKEETYGLVAQMRRASVSVPSNLAEGAAMTSKGVFAVHKRCSGVSERTGYPVGAFHDARLYRGGRWQGFTG